MIHESLDLVDLSEETKKIVYKILAVILNICEHRQHTDSRNWIRLLVSIKYIWKVPRECSNFTKHSDDWIARVSAHVYYKRRWNQWNQYKVNILNILNMKWTFQEIFWAYLTLLLIWKIWKSTFKTREPSVHNDKWHIRWQIFKQCVLPAIVMIRMIRSRYISEEKFRVPRKAIEWVMLEMLLPDKNGIVLSTLFRL